MTIENITEVIRAEDMIINYFQEFKRYWCGIYSEQFKNANTLLEKRKIKDNIYKNINLTESEKDEVWELIMRLSSC